MSKQVLKLKYHPAKKEIEFKRFQSGKENFIARNSRLQKYMNQKGNFIIQNQGDNFFNDIAKAFDGEKSVKIEVTTTEIDYNDFGKMVENYNNSENCLCHFTHELSSMLPDMSKTFESIERYGKDSIGILSDFRDSLTLFKFKTDDVQKSVLKLDREIKSRIDEVKCKIKNLNDNKVNLCFTGVYSSGKSTLINALLGYKILPESIKSETAKMIEISSPVAGENVSLKFKIAEEFSRLEWNENERCFEFVNGPQECDIRTQLQSLLNDLQSEGIEQYTQIYEILKVLNSGKEISKYISSTIEVFFPISLDNENIQFKIFDTPGSDSNCPEHKVALRKALEEQTQSILIFVTTPDRLEGTGNNSLLMDLMEVDQSSTTSIDMARSLFIINKAETIDSVEREMLQNEEIKSQSKTIKLSESKLFFLSAKNAYAAKSKINGTADKREIQIIKKNIPDDEEDLLYRQNRSAHSQFATNKLIELCDGALRMAEEMDKGENIVFVSSGMYALENEIHQFAERHASSVRAFAIIDCMDKVVTNLSQKSESLRKANQQSIDNIDDLIKNFNDFLICAIESKKNEALRQLDEEKNSGGRLAISLGITAENFETSVVNPVRQEIKKKLSRWLPVSGKIKMKGGDGEEIRETINPLIEEFYNRCILNHNRLIEEKQTEFIEAIKDIIRQNGDIDEEVKRYMLDTSVPHIDINNLTNWNEVYERNVMERKRFFIKTKRLDKESLLNDIEQELSQKLENLFDCFIENYSNNLESIMDHLKLHYSNNLDRYSLKLKSMNVIKDERKQLGEEMYKIVGRLKQCEKEIDGLIWEAQ